MARDPAHEAVPPIDPESPEFFDVALSERPEAGVPLETLAETGITRRAVLTRFGAGAALAPAAAGLLAAPDAARAVGAPGLRFRPVRPSTEDAVIVPAGYRFDVVAAWGDGLAEGVDNLDALEVLAGGLMRPGAGRLQARRFGYNNDAIKYFPLETDAQGRDIRGLLCVNHEFLNSDLMFPGHPGRGGASTAFKTANPETVAVEKAALGVSVVEVTRRIAGEHSHWAIVPASRFNRRIHAETEMEIAGPASGHPLLRTTADPAARRVLGTLCNCAGGMTPWGTYLTCEENFDNWFGNADGWGDRDPRVEDAHRRLPLPGRREAGHYGWLAVDPRFDVAAEPTESLRFGWVVEIDPMDPASRPKKRTALGRFKHEGAEGTIAPDGRYVVYTGDDARFEYVFKFVTRDRVTGVPARDRGLLDQGTLYAARFEADGTGRWLALTHGEGPLTAENGFADQGEVLIKARRAADLLGATPMDRPEDIEISPATRKVYVALTKSGRRTAGDNFAEAQGRIVNTAANAANPRAGNTAGHILEIAEANGDNAAETFTWQVFLLCGDAMSASGAMLTRAEDVREAPLRDGDTYFGGWADPHAVVPVACPDNLTIDAAGNLWILTDGNDALHGYNDGLFAVATEGPERGLVRQFLSAPVGSEVCGGALTPDGETLFVAVQHPGEGGSLSAPTSRFPGNSPVPKPAVIAVTRAAPGAKTIGS